MFLKCSQHIRVRTIYRGRSGNRKLFVSVPYTLGSAQYTIVIQEIGNNFCDAPNALGSGQYIMVVQKIGKKKLKLYC